MHAQAFDFIAHHAGTVSPTSVLELGSLDINGGIRSLFAGANHYHGLDVVEGPGVDEVADAADWRPQQRFDVVVSTEVLEHAPRWPDVVCNAWAALESGGTLLLTCATDPRPPHSAVDGWGLRDGEWYANVGPQQLLGLLRSFDPEAWLVEVARDRGDLYARIDKR
jgi:hypothetical protein